ncbi:MAG TPA: folylpolyglutamate synthase/dihydrofolate synthase family protein [Actinomycetes bacterium]|nr:folylpolyglutamate synthase/dihydrofolate synthase family protein [Actinomycetes bacterium]
MTDSTPEELDVASRLREVEVELLARWPETRIDPTLERVETLLDLLGSPQRSVPIIQVAGTNGKTSTARMVESLLRAFGLRTGLFTSPHVESMTERIALAGRPIDPVRFVSTYEDIEPYLRLVDERSQTPVSYFEAMTTLAYAAFADAPVDVAVVEVGLGGRWDATNAADAQVAIVTPIDLDHVNYLGDTLEEIAAEKAGIIKPGSVVVLAQQRLPAAEVLLRAAAAADATVARETVEFGVLHRELAMGGQVLSLQGLAGSYEEVFLPLYGEHQARNAACALAAVEAFFGATTERLRIDLVIEGFGSVTSPGRLEVVKRGPTVLLDAAHNPAGAAATAAAVQESFSFTRLVGVIAIMVDKDARGVLEALEPVLDEVVVTQNSSTRSLLAGQLAEFAEEIFGGHRVTVEPRLADALDTGIRLAEAAGDLGGAGVLVTGSVVTVGEARRMLRGVR